MHLKTEPHCREGYLRLEVAERPERGRVRRDLVLATLHIIQQGGYLHWGIWGLMADGTLAKFGQCHTRRQAEEVLERYRSFARRASRIQNAELGMYLESIGMGNRTSDAEPEKFWKGLSG